MQKILLEIKEYKQHKIMRFLHQKRRTEKTFNHNNDGMILVQLNVCTFIKA